MSPIKKTAQAIVNSIIVELLDIPDIDSAIQRMDPEEWKELREDIEALTETALYRFKTNMVKV